jgi:serine protease Do
MKGCHSLRFCSLYLAAWLIMAGSASVQARPDSFSQIVKSEKEKVVYISTSGIVERRSRQLDPWLEPFFRNIPERERQQALGSGFIISPDGYIVTNHHVISQADKIEVQLYDGKTFKAEIVGMDKLTELALIKIEATDLPFIKWGDSSAVEVGDWVLAIGNPLGFEHTVTAGILSARGRSVFGTTAYGQFLQTDAAINFGNSGGPLFNMAAEVIGINTAIAAGGQNLGFAIPSNLARTVIDQLREHGTVERGWFGVGIQDVNEELAASFGLPEGLRGVILTEVGLDSPAEKGGLQKGDIVVEYNGEPLTRSAMLQQLVAETPPGATVTVKVFRKGSFLTRKITVDRRPADDAISLDETRNLFGMRLVEISAEARQRMSLKEEYGLLVLEIDQTGVAWERGIRQNDIILEADNRKVEALSDFSDVVREAVKNGKPISLLISRGGRSIYLALPVN